MPLRLIAAALATAVIAAACGGAQQRGPGGEPARAVEDDWARDRVEAVLSLYSFSPEGEAAVRDLRVLHVVGRPGWFGSTGYENWVGIGDARPGSIVHELSHSFWGAFSVAGRSDVTWTITHETGLLDGIEALRRDLDAFMAQPPDAYEPLRARLRQIPDLVTGGFPGLYHLGEAEIVVFTGGNLNLVPPILRKYYAPWLEPGPFANWDEAALWYLGLPAEERRKADAFFSVGGLAIDAYEAEVDPAARLAPETAAVVEAERRRRLADFAEQFDLFFKDLDGTGAPAEDFRFWGGYLRGIIRLFPEHADVLDAPRFRRLREAIEALAEIRGLNREARGPAARESIAGDRFLLNLAPALDQSTLAELVRGDGTRTGERVSGLIQEALDPSHVKLLQAAVELQDLAREDPQGARSRFDALIGGLAPRERQAMNFILDLFAQVDRELTIHLLTGLSPEAARLVYDEGPAFVRFLLQPEQLIDVLGFASVSDPERLTELAKLFTEKVSATPSIDEPFLEALYRRVVALGETSPAQALEVFAASGLWLEPFLRLMPQKAAVLLEAEPALAAKVLREANPVRVPPARAIYRVVQANPTVAARLTLEFDRQGDGETVADALAFFAYDLPRKASQPSLPISLERDGEYLAALLDLAGPQWLASALDQTVDRYRAMIDRAELDPEFLQVYHRTVSSSVETVPDVQAREALRSIVRQVFGPSA